MFGTIAKCTASTPSTGHRLSQSKHNRKDTRRHAKHVRTFIGGNGGAPGPPPPPAVGEGCGCCSPPPPPLSEGSIVAPSYPFVRLRLRLRWPAAGGCCCGPRRLQEAATTLGPTQAPGRTLRLACVMCINVWGDARGRDESISHATTLSVCLLRRRRRSRRPVGNLRASRIIENVQARGGRALHSPRPIVSCRRISTRRRALRVHSVPIDLPAPPARRGSRPSTRGAPPTPPHAPPRAR